MKEICVEELKRLQLDILSKVDLFCRHAGIRYFLAAGSCIGAVRHKGYIPWDDDIDIGMPRPDYEKFVHSFNGSIEHLQVYAPELDWDYYVPYANVCDNRTILIEDNNNHHGIEIGVKIDVFPFDGIPSSIKEYQKEKKRVAILWDYMFSKRMPIKGLWRKNPRSLIHRLKNRVITAFRNYRSLQKEIRKIAISHSYEEAKYAIDIVMPWNRDVMCEKQAFEEVIDVPFENITVSIMKGYDRYLSLRYGDYMKMPPIEEQVPHHGFTAYWKE